MTTRYFCTLFDSGYLVKGVAMIRSLGKFCPGMQIYVLCMDAQSKEILEKMDLPGLHCITLAEVETPALLHAKSNRGVAEYCWTLSSNFTQHVMINQPHIDMITYVDADLLFYSDVQPLFDEIGDASISIIEHRFTERLKDREVNGRFCVEWVGFRRDAEGLACLSRWAQQCVDWCYYRLEDGKMGDQKYLDEWPDLYDSCHILMHKGAGIAPWNYAQYVFETNSAGDITVEGDALIFYHFHQFQLLENGRYDRLSRFYTSDCKEPESVYTLYEREIAKTLADIRILVPGFSAGLKAPAKVGLRRYAQRYMPMWIKDIGRKFVRY